MIASVTCEVLANHLAGDTAIPGLSRPWDGGRYDDFRGAAQCGVYAMALMGVRRS